jgi:hypothetical protein
MNQRKAPRGLMLVIVGFASSCVQPFEDRADSGLVLQVGADSLVRTDTPPEGACPAGGRVYTAGTDKNGDGVLQSDEVSSSSLVCDGEDARLQRTRVTTVPDGDAFCAAGGFVVGFGDDRDGSGVLDPVEVQTSLTICHGEPAAPGTTLDTLPGCIEGDIPQRAADGTWSCAAPPDGTSFALSAQECPAPLVVTGISLDGTLRCDTPEDVLGTLACTAGQVAKWSGSAWVCDVDESADPGTDTLAGLTCASGQVAKWTGAVWACAFDTNTDVVAGLTCVNGQLPKFNGTTWVCAGDNDTLVGLSCLNGQQAKFNGTTWVCASDNDTLAGLACAAGQVAKWSGAVWLCALDTDTNSDTLAALSCASGQVAKWNGTSWACAADVDTDTNTDTLAALMCASGQVAKWNGTSWACAADVDTDTNTDTLAALTCASGQVAKWNGTSWACAADIDTDTDTDTDTLADLLCAAGEVAKYDGAAWACALDDDGAASLFVRTVHVAATGTAVENGTLLRTTLASLVAPSSTNRFTLELEAGTYDLGATALPLRSFVDIVGAGARATLITGTADAGAGNAVITGADRVTLRALGITGSGATVRVLSSTSALPELDHVTITASGTVSVRAISLSTLGALTTKRRLSTVTLDVTGGGTADCDGLTVAAPQTSPDVYVEFLRVALDDCVTGTALEVPPAWRVMGAQIDIDGEVAGATLSGAVVAGMLSSARIEVSTLGASSTTVLGVVCSGTTGIVDTSRVLSSGAAAASVSVQAFHVPAATSCALTGNTASLTGATDAFGVLVASGGTATVASSLMRVDGSVAAFGVWSEGSVRVRQSTLTTTSTGGAAFVVDAGTGRCDHCVLEGFNDAIVATGTAFVGASQIGGAVSGTGTVKCVASYDENYDAITCP